MALVSIGEAAAMLGVAVVTLRRWHREGKLLPACRTIGRHRRYELEQPERLAKPTSAQEKLTVAYARVSSHDQKEQLQWQAQRLRQHCIAKGWCHEVITDLGSGMNMRKPGLARLLRLLLSGDVGRLVLVTRDRLLRFGAELVFSICRLRGVEVVLLDPEPQASREQQLASDLVEIITFFSSRLYGSRSRKNVRGVAPAWSCSVYWTGIQYAARPQDPA